MDKINVLIATRLDETLWHQIANVDRRVNVCYVAELVRNELRRAAQEEPPGEKSSDLDGLLREAEVILMPMSALIRSASWDFLARSPKLKWVQLFSAGIDGVAKTGVLKSDVIVTDASGVAAIPIAECVLGTMLMFAKKAPLCFRNKQKKQWERFLPSELKGKTLGIIGLGNIGQETARLAKVFGMRVVGTKRSIVKQELSAMEVDKVYPRHDLLEMLGECDFVALAVPLTEETAKMIGEQELKAMKPTSYLINIARGGVMDESTLIQALKEEWIAGAGLDVFESEPLPPENELWEMPNVILSPHIAGGSEMYGTRLTELFCENLKLYLNGQPLLNVVDKGKGY